MSYANNQNLNIHYEVVGDGPALVLQHGFSSNLARWFQCGYVDALAHHYRLILIDARGHGASDKPHEAAAYALSNRVADVVAVLDHLRLRQAHYFGYSMGGWIGFGMAQYAPDRLRSLTIGGAHPYLDQTWESFKSIDGSDPQAFTHALETVTAEPLPAETKPVLLANDLRALAAAAQVRPALDHLLPQMKMPCLLFVGEADARCAAVQICARQIAHAKYFSLPGQTHGSALMRSDLVLPHLAAFLANQPD